MGRRRGFTLIELLVVIAIIGILAAMLFPVFARARESARKIQCLSNVKNLALAFQMYFSDYDRFPPREHDAAKLAWWGDERPDCDLSPGCCNYPSLVNPYLRVPVVLDEYIKNRDVWRCPSAKWVGGAKHVYGQVDWWTEWRAEWNCACTAWFPPGWGPPGVDSAINVDGCPAEDIEPGPGYFENDYTTPEGVYGQIERSVSTINDPARYLVIAERGIDNTYDRVEKIAYPEVCRITWGRIVDEGECIGNGDPPQDITADEIDTFWHDATWRNRYTRHMGGNNLGFADGHAKWWAADALLAAANAQDGSIEPVPPLHVPDAVPGAHY